MSRRLVLSFLAVLAACGPAALRDDAGLPVADAGLLDGGAPDAGLVATVRVHYPSASGAMYLRGSVAPASWDVGLAMTAGGADTWTLTFPALTRPLELKPDLDDAHWAKGPNWTLHPGETLEVWPRFFTDSGQWSRKWDFSSTLLGNTRGVWVYLPPTSLENPTYRAPVLYMHDGQNLFDPAAAFGGVTWQVPETLDAAAQDASILEVIVVGPENAGAARLDEYTPTADPSYGGGKGELYLRMLVEELKPKVDAELKTRPERDSTYLMGSSLGGLITGWAGVTHSDVFGRIGVVSPSTWWDGRVLLTKVATTAAAPRRPTRVYLDCGDQNDGLADTQDLAKAYRALGYADDKDFLFVVQAGAAHNETYWAQRLPRALRFLIGPGR